MLNIFNTLPSWIFCFVIFFSKVLEIFLSSMKTIFLVKGNRLLLSVFAFLEVLIWAIIVSGVIVGLNENIYWLLAYCLGYTLGYYVGSIVNSRLMLGNINIQFIIPIEYVLSVKKYLHNNKIGYFITDVCGDKDKRKLVTINTASKNARGIRHDISTICENNIFTMNFDIAYLHGGYGISK